MIMKDKTRKILVNVLVMLAVLMLAFGIHHQTINTVNDMQKEHVEWMDSSRQTWDSTMPVSPLLRDYPLER